MEQVKIFYGYIVDDNSALELTNDINLWLSEEDQKHIIIKERKSHWHKECFIISIFYETGIGL